jgi:hypothetical protein
MIESRHGYEYNISQNVSSDKNHEVHGKWFVSKHVEKDWQDWLLHWSGYSNPLPPSWFLHKDGTWVMNSTFKDGQWSGYYDTEKEAREAYERSKH